MIPRYTPQPFAQLWSPIAKYATWLQVELAACEAMEHPSVALVPPGTAQRLRDARLAIDPARIDEIEGTVKHDVIAFLTHVEELAARHDESVAEAARWLHFGMTSSDVLDTSFALLLVQAADLLASRLEGLVESLAARADEHRHVPMIGRSHGIHAEPITFGMALAGHLAEMKRGRERLAAARDEIAVGKLAGAVGSYAHLEPAIERRALAALGLRGETVATQVVARDRHAAFFCSLGVIAAGIERLATNVRHWQRTEVAEAEESFTAGQKGSSAMPHKRNPILSENLCGLARVVRSSVVAALEDVALWHERDISHSSVERMIAPDATTTLGFMLERATRLIRGLQVDPDRMQRNLELTEGRCYSEALLLELVKAGKPRQEAYRLVQRAAMKSYEGVGSFAELLAADPEVTALLPTELVRRCFEPSHALRHVDEIIDRALRAP